MKSRPSAADGDDEEIAEEIATDNATEALLFSLRVQDSAVDDRAFMVKDGI